MAGPIPPTTNFNGSDVFEYQVKDGQASSATYTVTLNVTAVNDAPVAVDDSFALIANDQAAYTLDVLTNDTDVDEDTLQLDWGETNFRAGQPSRWQDPAGHHTKRYGNGAVRGLLMATAGKRRLKHGDH